MSAGNTLKAMPMITVDASTISEVSYTEVTPPGGLPVPLTILFVYNDSSVYYLLSYDGVTDHDILTGGGSATTAPLSASPNNWVSKFPKGLKIFLKAKNSGAIGEIYIRGFYQN